MDIAAWNPNSSEAVTSPSDGRRLKLAQLWGLLGTLLLHTLVLQTAILGTRATKVRPPDSQVLGATLIKSAAEPTEELILLEVSGAAANARVSPEDFSSTGSAPTLALEVLISLGSLPHVNIPPDELDARADKVAQQDSGDPAGRALLFGRYSGQIQARIERAWQRPRSPVSEDLAPHVAQSGFHCQVRILQDAHGDVQEVQMLDCNGTVAWQHSLVTGILAASPLPAPPDPSVFTRSLTMTFEGQAYVAGGSSDGFGVDHATAVPVVGGGSR